MRNRVCVAAFAAVLGVAGLTAPSASSAAARAGAPAPVRSLAPFEQSESVVLRWTNPRTLDRDVVRIARGPDAPATVHDGRSVKLGSPRVSKAVLGRLPAGRQFSVSVWTQRGSKLSRKMTTSFTTKPVEARRTSALGGKVVDSAGNPLRNAIVLAYDYTTFAHLFRARTGASGNFRMLVPPGHYEIAALGTHALGGSSDRTGYLFAVREVTVRPGNVHDGINFTLATAAAIAGSVTDIHGHPIAGVPVEPTEAPAYLGTDLGIAIGGLGAAGTARTDRSGHYLVKGLIPGAEVPCFDAAGFVSRCATTSVEARTGHVTQAPRTSLASVAQAPHGTIAGTVLDAKSHPISRAVVLASAGGSNAGIIARTNRRGRFTLPNLSVGPWQVCAASGSADGGFGTVRCRQVTVSARHTTTVELRLPPAGALSGLVRGPSGRRLGSVGISAIHQTAHGFASYDGATDLNGAWTINGLPPGVYTICISAGGASSAADPTGGRSTCLHRKFHVVGEADRIGVDQTLAPAGAISGIVTDSSGNPTRAGVVLSRGRGFNSTTVSTASARDGHFRMTGLTPGLYRVCAEQDYSIGTVTRHCLSHRVASVAGKVRNAGRIALPSATALTVSVTDGGGHALAGVDVAILRGCGQNFCSVQPVFSATHAVQVSASESTGIAGRAAFRGLRPGHYTACALAYYAASATSVPATGFADKCASKTFSLTLTRGSGSSAAISLEPGAAVTGLVQDSHGNAAPNVAVHGGGSAAFDYSNPYNFYDPLTPSPQNDVLTDASGHYVIRSIAPGSRRICGVPPRALHLKRGCLSSSVSLPASTTTQAPTLTLNSAGASSFGRSAVVFAQVRSLLPVARVFPQNRRIPVINSTGWPEFRLLPRSKP